MPKKEKEFTVNIRRKTIHRSNCWHIGQVDPQYCSSYYTYDEAKSAHPACSDCMDCSPEL